MRHDREKTDVLAEIIYNIQFFQNLHAINSRNEAYDRERKDVLRSLSNFI